MLVPVKTALSPMLEQVRAWLNAGATRIRLYKNDYTPTPDSVLSNFVSADFPGYAFKATGAWAPAALNAQGYAQITTAAAVFTMTGSSPANTIFGYFITTSADDLLWAERNPAGGVAMNAAGLSYTVYPQYVMRGDNAFLAAMEAQQGSAEQLAQVDAGEQQPKEPQQPTRPGRPAPQQPKEPQQPKQPKQPQQPTRPAPQQPQPSSGRPDSKDKPTPSTSGQPGGR